MNRFKRRISILLLLVVGAFVPSWGSDHTVATTVEITQAAMNRYLNAQYNAAGFPQNIPVNVEGVTYIISLNVPEIVLSTGSAKLRMVFDVWQGENLVYHFLVQPSIDIPTGQVTATQVEAFFTNLQTVLNAITPILPQWVRDNIVATFNSLGWIVYPTKLIDQLNTTWFAQ